MNTGVRSQKSYLFKHGISTLATAEVAGFSHAIVMIAWAILKTIDVILPALAIRPAANQYLPSAREFSQPSGCPASLFKKLENVMRSIWLPGVWDIGRQTETRTPQTNNPDSVREEILAESRPKEQNELRKSSA